LKYSKIKIVLKWKIPIYVLLSTIIIGACITVSFGWAVRHVAISKYDKLASNHLGVFGEVLYAIAEFPSLAKQAVKEVTNSGHQLFDSNIPDLDGITFTSHTITTDALYAEAVYAVDLDGDKDIDVLSASYADDKIAWYKNDGENDPSFTAHTITTHADGAYSVFAADVNGDGYMDVLSASYADDKIAWYKNNGENDPSFTAHTITTSADGAFSVYAVDVDGDGDIDVLSASRADDKIAWYKNDGENDPSFTAHTITTSADGAYSVYAVDVNGDGYMDVLSASYDDDKIAWYKNDGNENFATHIISTSAIEAVSVYAVDVNGDGYMDVLSASHDDDKIAWYKNDGDENFISKIISTSAVHAFSVYAVDVDDDGDIDVLSASGKDDKIAWYENRGSASFTAHNVNQPDTDGGANPNNGDANGANFVYAVDMDGDGDIDVLSASFLDNKISWYEQENGSVPSVFYIRDEDSY